LEIDSFFLTYTNLRVVKLLQSQETKFAKMLKMFSNRGRYYSSRLESERPSPIRGNSGKYSARPSDVKTVQGHGARNDHP